MTSKPTEIPYDFLSGWQPIATAPRDGTTVELTWMDNGRPQEIFPMQWGHIQRNKLFAGDTVGMWVMPNGGATWTEHDPDGAPTHWRPVTELTSPLSSNMRGTDQ